MAIYHLNVQTIGRSQGRSATGAAAYRAGVEITDERTGLVHDYTRKRGIGPTAILAPKGAPEWTMDRAALWNAVERAEKRVDAQLCRELDIALPTELNAGQMRELLEGYLREQFVARGMVADMAMHDLGSDNPHAHVLLTMRPLTADGFGSKARDWNRRELVQEWREAWAEHANRALELAGHEARIDHRTLEAQGIERKPQIHLGPRVIEMEAKGRSTDRGDKALAIDQDNRRIAELIDQRELVDHERHRAIEASQELGRSSVRDRATGPGPGGDLGRNPARAGGAERSPLSPGAGLGRAAEGGDTRTEPSRAAAPGGGGGLDGRGERGAVEADPAFRPDGRGRGGAYDRVVALAADADGRREAPTGDRAGSGGPVADADDRAAGRTPGADGVGVDRTYLAVRRQLDAMGAAAYEVGIRDREGRMMTRQWDRAEVLAAVPWLKRHNARGADIYVRPAGEQNAGLVLVDDLTRGQLGRMNSEGMTPAAVVETSPANYQAWVRVSPSPLAPEVATATAAALARRYEGDPASADWRHFGRLAGFTNRKPQHVTETGRSPWVLCHEASGQPAENGQKLVTMAEQLCLERNARAERAKRLQEAEKPPGRDYRAGPAVEYRRQLKRLLERYGPSADLSRVDFMIATDMATRGFGAESIRQAMEEASPELPVRKAGREADYCARTVQAVFERPEVQEALEARRQDRDGPSLSR